MIDISFKSDRILIKRYVRGESWLDIAAELHRSRTSIYHTHLAAQKALESKIHLKNEQK